MELYDGTLLCSLLNSVFPSAAIEIDDSGGDDATQTNFEAFREGCAALGLSQDQLFTAEELQMDPDRVTPCVLALRDLAGAAAESGNPMKRAIGSDAGSDVASTDAAFRTPISLPATPVRGDVSTHVEVDQTTHARVAALEAVSSGEWQAMLNHSNEWPEDDDDDEEMTGAFSVRPRPQRARSDATTYAHLPP